MDRNRWAKVDDNGSLRTYVLIMRAVLCFIVVLAFGGSAQAQSRPAPDRQGLVDLSRVMGESHALRQLCRDVADTFWRDRMKAMVVAERAEPVLEDAMIAAFNTGYEVRERQFSSCNAAAHQAEAQVSAKGQTLARRLAKPG